MTVSESVLSVRNLVVEYQGARPVTAVRDVSLELGRGEIVGLAGESGCGKSTFAYGINQLLRPPARIVSGEVVFHDRDGHDIDVLRLTGKDLRKYRWDKASMVFQGSMNSLNPVVRIAKQLRDVYTTHRPQTDRAEVDRRCSELLEAVGVDPDRRHSFAHELSGGMRQRVMIAMALALQPQLIIMDEPTTALDVLVQRDIMLEIQRLKRNFGFAVLFITHDLPLLLEISDRIAVMKEGSVVELNTVEQIYSAPQHPYTQELLKSFPTLFGDRASVVTSPAPMQEQR